MLSDATGAESDVMFDALHQITPIPPLHQTLDQTPQITPIPPVASNAASNSASDVASDGCIGLETPCFNPGTTRLILLNGANPNWSTVREGGPRAPYTALIRFKVESLRWSMLDFPRTLRSHLTQHAGRGPEAKVRHAGGGRFFVSERTLAVLSRISKRSSIRAGTPGSPTNSTQ